MISVKNVTVKFEDNIVLNNIVIDFEQGKIHGIVGLNGAGKTTFFNVMAGVIKPDTGKIIFNVNELRRADTGYLETVNYFYSKITGNEYLKIFKQTNLNFNLAAIQEFLKLPLDELIENYSTGMKKKVALLGILKQDKPIYLLDEPFNGLDLETNKILEIILSALKEKGKTIFVSSHIIEPLINVCDKIHLLQKGIFIRTFERNDFDKIDDEVFGQLKQQARTIISVSV